MKKADKHICIVFALVMLALLPAARVCLGQLTYATLVVQYDSVWKFNNLSLVPIRFIQPAPAFALQPDAIGLQQALHENKARLKEVLYENGANVNWLHITNESKHTIFVNSGELLAGGKQDRMVAEAMLLEPGTSAYLKVYCIEKGRWDEKVKPFVHSGEADIQLKKVMDTKARQAEIWKEIERQYTMQSNSSDTWPYLKLRRTRLAGDTAYNRFFLNRFATSDSNYAGFLALKDGEIINCEIFASSRLLSLSFRSMLVGLTTFASANQQQGNGKDDVKIFMDNLLQSESSQKAFVPKRGALHKWNDKVMHIIAYGRYP